MLNSYTFEDTDDVFEREPFNVVFQDEIGKLYINSIHTHGHLRTIPSCMASVVGMKENRRGILNHIKPRTT